MDVLSGTIQTYLLDNHLLECVQAMMVNPQFTNGRELMDSYHFPEDMAYNCIFFEGKSGHNLINIATLVPFGKRVDSKMIKKQLGLCDLHLMDKVKAEMLTGQSFGILRPLLCHLIGYLSLNQKFSKRIASSLGLVSLWQHCNTNMYFKTSTSFSTVIPVL